MVEHGTDTALGEHREKDPSWSRSARLISNISHPLYVSPLIILVASFKNTSNTAAAFYWWGIYQIFAAIIPLADLIWRRRTGRISDWHVSKREERKWPLIFGIVYAAAGSLAFYLLSGPSILLASMLSGLALGMITFSVTSFWKISLHLMGNGSLTIILLAAFEEPILSIFGLLLLFYLAAIGLSRYAVRAHTPSQIIMGAISGIGVTWLVFWCMGIPV
jgi:membrane-associated phospholipid phosphatase